MRLRAQMFPRLVLDRCCEKSVSLDQTRLVVTFVEREQRPPWFLDRLTCRTHSKFSFSVRMNRLLQPSPSGAPDEGRRTLDADDIYCDRDRAARKNRQATPGSGVVALVDWAPARVPRSPPWTQIGSESCFWLVVEGRCCQQDRGRHAGLLACRAPAGPAG